MTPDTQARAGYRRPRVRQAASEQAASGTTVRSEGLTAAAARTGYPQPGPQAGQPQAGWWDAPARPLPAPSPSQAPVSREGRPPYPSRASGRAARRAREDASIARVVPLLAVMVVTAAGVYIAWQKGSSGGGEGGVVAGAGLLAAAVARLLLPARAVGLLATRKRALDVTTL